MPQYKITKKRLAEIIKEEYEAILTQEASKPDFLDLDKDGDKEESMKDAAKDEDELEEGYMDKYDRAYEEEERERRRQSRRIDRERERNQRSGGYRRPGAGSGMGGIGGGGKRPERFAGFNRDDDELKGGQKKLDQDKDGDIDEKDLEALRAKKKVKKESLDSIRALIQQELKNI